MTAAQHNRIKAIERRRTTVAFEHECVHVPVWGDDRTAMQGDIIIAYHSEQWGDDVSVSDAPMIITPDGNCYTAWQLSGV